VKDSIDPMDSFKNPSPLITRIINFDLRRMDDSRIKALKTIIFLMSLAPLARLSYGGLLDQLGANPIEKILRQTGFWTLTFLTLTMAVTPIRRWFGLIWLARLRRMLGLYAFFYGLLHLATYVVLDQYFDWEGIVKDITKRPYITIGFTALVLMIPLALTSTNRMQRFLGGERWRRLHKLTYLIALGGIIHFWWLVKKDISEPLIFALIYVVSILLRSRRSRRNEKMRPTV